jgi:hypothetical protein
VKLVYFISPVGSDPGYRKKREVLSAVALDQDLEFFFPLDRHTGFSVDAASQDLRKSWLAIADLSLERPSCYFEVGLAQGIGTPVALIATEGTVLHQAGGTGKILRYSSLETYQTSVLEILAQRKQSDAFHDFPALSSTRILVPRFSS